MEQNKKISFFAPSFIEYDVGKFKNINNLSSFTSVRITGERCPLNCLHCQGTILKSMEKVKSCDELFDFAKCKKDKGCNGILLTGASNKNGSVPLKKFKDAMVRIKDELGMSIVVHSGVCVDKELAKVFSYSKVDAVMFDVVGSEKTLYEICNLSYSIDIYKRTFENLMIYNLPVVPHIVIGLHFGKIIGEENAINIISNYDISSLVFVLINPLPGTPMEYVKTPEIYRVSEIFSYAKKLIPKKPILLGCAKPKGKIRKQIEELALLNNFEGIAFPSAETIYIAEKNGYKMNFNYKCCSLYRNFF